MKAIEMSVNDWTVIEMILLLGTQSRKREQETYKKLADEYAAEDPELTRKMSSNAEFYQKAEGIIDTLINKISGRE